MPSTYLFFGNSFLHLNECDPFIFENLFVIPELTWMTQTDEDQNILLNFNDKWGELKNHLTELSNSVANFNKNSNIDFKKFENDAINLMMILIKLMFFRH